MRTTLRIEDDLLRELKQQALEQKLSLNRLVNRALRLGLEQVREGTRPRRRIKEKVYSMGAPRVPIDKALALAAAIEDDESIEKMSRRK